jgi:hypothetical protein
MYRRLPVWFACLALWTAAQLIPNPDAVLRDIFSFATDDGAGDSAESSWVDAILSPVFWDVAHVFSYATLAILGGWLRLPSPWQWLLLVFLSLHGIVIEYVQGFMPTRYSTLADIGWNHLGLFVGVILSYRWWLAPSDPVRAL